MSNENSFVGLQTGLSDQAQQMLANFWPQAIENIKNLSASDYKAQELPLARIKKIMKLDEDVKMISGEAPVLFAKAAEIFVSELSLRAWIHTEDNKRRTLQRNDIATAISKYDQFDFLIDIVPREELKPTKRSDDPSRTGSSLPEQIQYYLQLAQQQSQGQQQQTQTQQSPAQAAQPAQQQAQTTAAQVQAQAVPVSQAAEAIILQQIQQQQQQQQQQHRNTQQAQQVTTSVAPAQNAATTVQLQGGQLIQQPQFQIQQSSQGQVIQLPQQVTQQVVSPIQNTVLQQLQQQQQQQQQQLQTAAAAAAAQPQQPQQAQPQQQQQQQAPAQVYQQVMNAQGQMENIPIQLTPQQLQAIQLQLQNKQIVVQHQQQADQTVQFSQPQQMFQLQQAAGGQQQIFIQSGDDQTDGTTDS